MNATTANGSVRPILVGIDGSPSALAAARWAAREAVVRRAPIRLVYAFGWMPVHDADDPVQIVPDARDALRRTAEERLAAAAAQVAEVAPDVAVSQEVTTGMPAALLVSLSAEAQLAVVGHRGLGGFAGLVIGSVGTALAAHAACSVVVVRGPDARARTARSSSGWTDRRRARRRWPSPWRRRSHAESRCVRCAPGWTPPCRTW